jgi:phospholipase A1
MIKRIYLPAYIMLLLSVTLNAQTNRKLLENENFNQRWETDSASKKGTFVVTPYQPIYFLLANYSNNPNRSPASLNPTYAVPAGVEIPLKETELKFQLSFKTKIIEDLFGRLSIWAAYTQTSRWQVYNAESSRAFRETNYEPEVIANIATHYNFLGFNGNMAGLAFNHQSNGRAIPFSRSWNRIIAHAMFERQNWGVRVRGWYRLEDADDENPEITQYVGVGDILIAHNLGQHQVSALMRNNLNFNQNRGSILLDWAIPISGHLKGYIQLFHGYGESMIDYNHKQTTIGAGVSLINWR